jgi:hypothetical protein
MDEPEPRAKRGVVVKRRWAIVQGRGGRAAILATVGALALGAPNGGANTGQPSGQGDDPAEIVATPDEDQR